MLPDPPRGVDVALVGAEIEESLSLRYLVSACGEAGLDARVVPFASAAEIPRVVAEVLAARPLAVGLSMTFQSRCREFIRLAERLREAGFTGHITAGGHFATLAGGPLLRDVGAIDSCVRNEGEETLVELLSLLRSGAGRAEILALPGIMARDDAGTIVKGPRRRLPPLDGLAWPDRSRPVDLSLGVTTATVLGSRGCHAECSFCSIQSFHREASGPRFRQRSPADHAAEMAWLHRTRGVRIFNFSDDTFFVPSRAKNVARFRELARALHAGGAGDVAVVVKCRPDDLDEESLDALTELGLLRVYVGIENGSEVGLRSLGRGMALGENERALALLRDRRVYHTFNLLLFDPDTTIATIAENLALLGAHAEVPFNFCRTEVYAGTPLEERLRRQGRLEGDYLGWGYRLADERAELVFRIASVAFHQRNFAPDGIATLNMGLRYDLEVLRFFYPGAWDEALHAAAIEASRAVGLSSVRRMREVLAFAAEVDLADETGIREHTVAVARAVHRDDFGLLGSFKRLRGEIEARAVRVGQPAQTPRVESAAAHRSA